MRKNTHTEFEVQPWQIEARKKRGSAKMRRAAFLMFKPDMAGNDAGDNATGAPSFLSGGFDAPAALTRSKSKMTTKNSVVNPTNTQLPTETGKTSPLGRRLAPNLAPAFLNPGAGKRVQRSGQSEFCGRVWGTAFGYTEHPNTKDASRMSHRFSGDFGFERGHEPGRNKATECYLPGTATRAIKAALDISHQPVPFALEIWCEPDERPGAPLGYTYAVYDRMPSNSQVDAIAIRAGIIAPAEARALLGHDPETGEVDADDTLAAA